MDRPEPYQDFTVQEVVKRGLTNEGRHTTMRYSWGKFDDNMVVFHKALRCGDNSKFLESIWMLRVVYRAY